MNDLNAATQVHTATPRSPRSWNNIGGTRTSPGAEVVSGARGREEERGKIGYVWQECFYRLIEE